MDATQCASAFSQPVIRPTCPRCSDFSAGSRENLPDDWPMRLKAAERAVAAGTSAPRPWRLLTSPEVARAVVGNDSDETSGFISIAPDPAGPGIAATPPRIELIHFELAKAVDGLWQVNLPSPFFQTAKDPDAVHDDEEEGDFDTDSSMLFQRHGSK